MKPLLIAFALAAAFLGAGCSNIPQTPLPGMKPWYALHEENFTKLKPGTPAKEVEQELGKPMNAMVFRNLGEEVWDYRFLNGTRRFIGEVHFDQQGRVKYVRTYPDSCPFTDPNCLTS